MFDIEVRNLSLILIAVLLLVLTLANIKVVVAQTGSEQIVFTEIMYDLEGSDDKREWVEIYNNSNQDIEINSDWRFYEGSNHMITVIQGDSILASAETVIIVDNPEYFLTDHPDYQGTILDSVVKLNNSGEEIKLSLDKGETWIVIVQYDSVAGANGDGYSLEFNDNSWQPSNDIGGSPGSCLFNNEQEDCDCEEEINDNENEQAEEPFDNNQQNEEPPQSPPEQKIVYSTNIYINEVVPDPDGSDEEGEFIELYNNDNQEIDLVGWQLSDNTDKIYNLSGIIVANGFLVIYRTDSGIVLNNSNGDTVELFNPNNELVNQVVYDKAVAAQSYSRTIIGEWEWTEELTPGQANLFPINEPPQAQISLSDTQFYTNQVVKFSAEDSFDPEGEIVSYEWEFGDGGGCNKKKCSYKYEKEGDYTVILGVTDKLGLKNSIELDLEIIEPATISTATVKDGDMLELQLISEIKELESNSAVYTQGIVTATPSLFAETYFYISEIDFDGNINLSTGIKIYFSKKEFPSLEVGNVIVVKGKLSQSGGEKRIRLSSVNNIEIIDSIEVPEASIILTGEVNDDYEGGLITVQGDLVDKKSTSWYLDDDSGEIRVYINKKTKIEKPAVELGQQIMITGVVSETKSGFRLMPRFNDDIILSQIINNETESQIKVISKRDRNIVNVGRSNESKVDDYLGYGLGVVGLSLLSWIARMKLFG